MVSVTPHWQGARQRRDRRGRWRGIGSNARRRRDPAEPTLTTCGETLSGCRSRPAPRIDKLTGFSRQIRLSSLGAILAMRMPCSSRERRLRVIPDSFAPRSSDRRTAGGAAVECWIGVVTEGDRRVVRLAGRLSVAHVPELLTACAEAQCPRNRSHRSRVGGPRRHRSAAAVP